MTEMRHNSFGSISNKKPEVKLEKPKMAELDLQSLIELGCIKETVDICGMVFKLRTLNISERMSLGDVLGSGQDSQKILEFNIYVLAMSVESVNGKLLEELNPNKNEDTLMLKKQILSSLQPQVIAKLMEFYTEITNRADAQFTAEQIKNS